MRSSPFLVIAADLRLPRESVAAQRTRSFRAAQQLFVDTTANALKKVISLMKEGGTVCTAARTHSTDLILLVKHVSQEISLAKELIVFPVTAVIHNPSRSTGQHGRSSNASRTSSAAR